MRQRGDLDCLHEPFGEAWYQGEAPLWPRFTEGEKTTPGLTLESVWADIQRRACEGPCLSRISLITLITCGHPSFWPALPMPFLLGIRKDANVTPPSMERFR